MKQNHNFFIPDDSNAHPDDAMLIEQLRAGDMDSYEVLFLRYYPLFLQFCRGMVKDTALAQDICQNVFMKIWIHRDRLQPELSMRNYIYVLCKREIIDYFRMSKASMFITLDQLGTPDIPDADPSTPLSMQLLKTRVREALATLPPKRREAFFLSRFRNMSNQEIAMRMGISVRTVEKHIQLALQTFRTHLGDTSDYLSIISIICLLDRMVA